ncbi:unnamed protein product, partial [Hapterophycus canaliculatus]
QDYEARTARAAKSNILHSFADGRQLGATGRTTQASAGGCQGDRALVLDMLSHLMDILAPTLRPLNPDLLSPQERARFRGLVGTLLSCGLTFAPQSAATPSPSTPSTALAPYGAAAGAQEFALEPAIDQLLMYEGYDFAHPRLAPPLRPMVAHEVNLEGMRQAEASKLAHREDAAKAGKNAAADPFTAAASTARKAASPFVVGGDATAAAAQAGSAPATAAGSDRRNVVETAAERKGEAAAAAAAATKKANSKTPPSSPPANKKFRDIEKDRPVHPVPFWNRTNWISGRKDGTGSRSSGGSNGNHKAATAAGKESTRVDPLDGVKSPAKRAVSEVAGTIGGTGKGKSESRLGAKAAAEPSKRARQEGAGKAGADEGVGKARIRYQFRAGYTNAVRRPVRMRDLL